MLSGPPPPGAASAPPPLRAAPGDAEEEQSFVQNPDGSVALLSDCGDGGSPTCAQPRMSPASQGGGAPGGFGGGPQGIGGPPQVFGGGPHSAQGGFGGGPQSYGGGGAQGGFAGGPPGFGVGPQGFGAGQQAGGVTYALPPSVPSGGLVVACSRCGRQIITPPGAPVFACICGQIMRAPPTQPQQPQGQVHMPPPPSHTASTLTVRCPRCSSTLGVPPGIPQVCCGSCMLIISVGGASQQPGMVMMPSGGVPMQIMHAQIGGGIGIHPPGGGGPVIHVPQYQRPPRSAWDSFWGGI